MDNTGDLTALKRCISEIIEKYQCASDQLDDKKMKEMKHIVRSNCKVIPELVNFLFHTVQHEDCEGRLAIVRICDQLFNRSHAFRLKMTDSFEDWLVYTVETDPLHYPLPPPKADASALKVGTMKVVKQWYEKFSSAYPKLSSAYYYLRSSKAFDFDRADAQLQAERLRSEELNRKNEQMAALIVEEVNAKCSEREKDILDCVAEVRNTLKLLVPKFEEGQEDDRWNLPGPSTAHSSQNALHAYTSSDTISVVVSPDTSLVEISESNEALVQSLMDSIKMLRFYNRLIAKWLNKLTKKGGNACAVVLKKLLNLRDTVGLELQRCEELKLPDFPKKKLGSSDSESDEFEDVPEKEGLELNFKYDDDHLAPHEIERIKQLEAGASINRKEEPGKSVDSSTSEPSIPEKSTIPVLPFGLDLKYWGDDNVKPAEIPVNDSDSHPFWHSSDESKPALTDMIESYKSRVMTFVGKEEIFNQCRAPLSDGRLCPRRDKYKCPVHGPIILRDDMGFPVNEVEGPVRSSDTTPADDAEYMRDLESATGVKLQEPQSSGSKRMRKTRRSEGKRPANRAQKVRDRLSAKIFNPRSIKRVTETLDAIQKANAAKRFEQQFNYALSRK